MIWLITSGHNAEDAKEPAQHHPAWQAAPEPAIDAFSHAQLRLWDSIARADDPDEWAYVVLAAATAWATQRQ
ncbi:hypothetical protein [Streptomyces sp. NPDC096311]|uniref:hypothetical protein n=1 Tax=Streptomyces sp. NPDC096311 TaxID=3366083 RepID=UPI003808C7F1